MTKQSWTVYYRIGGSDRFEWRRALPVSSHGEAMLVADSIRRGGRVAHVAPTAMLDSVGLPDTFDYSALDFESL